MPRFTKAELASYRGAFVPDLLGPDVRLLFVGINPGLWTAATQTHFAHPVNRFYPALLQVRDHRPPDRPGGGHGRRGPRLPPFARHRHHQPGPPGHRAGRRARRRRAPRGWGAAGPAGRRDPAGGGRGLGVTAYRSAFGQRKAVVGRQPEDLGGAQLWVVPNPSGLNAHATVDTLAAAYAEPARAAGILPAD